MNTKSSILIVAMLSVMLLQVATVYADDIHYFMDYKGMGLKSSVKLYYKPAGLYGYTTSAGQMKIEYQDQDYLGYCVDLYHYAGDCWVTEKDPASALRNGDLAAYLFETYAREVDTGLKAAALQVAVWEVISEKSSNDFDADGGLFRITKNDAVAGAANALLAGLPDYHVPDASTIVLECGCKQDMMIPEPGTLALLAAGGVLSLLRRRRTA